jgi:hypothetical protein
MNSQSAIWERDKKKISKEGPSKKNQSLIKKKT